jgi:ribosomal protein S18 acetylase RimI-like enzyme
MSNPDQEMNASDLLISRLATTADCESLAVLINNSYRSELACQGWTNENDLIDGLRTNVDDLQKIINATKSIILIFFDQTKQILIGCIHLQDKSEIKTAYLGMLAVRPDLQTRGYGKFILSVAEKYSISKWNVDYTELKVIIQRTELIDYYNRRGYTEVGQHQPFQPSAFGYPKRDDLELCTMRKFVKMSEEKIST